MPNEDEMLAGAGLPKWFAGSVRSLVGLIRLAAQPAGSVDTAADNATVHLGNLRHRAARDTPGFGDAARDVLGAIRELDSLTSRTHVNAAGYEAAVADLKTAAINALGQLVEVLRRAEPSEAVKALFVD